MFQRLAVTVSRLLNKPRAEEELRREIEFHLDQATQDLIRRGVAPADAARQARLRVGAMEPLKEECRETRLSHRIETLLSDLRYGARVLARNPGFSLAAILTLALGIGANTAIFSLVYGVLLRPLPYQRGGDLVVLHQRATSRGAADVPFSVAEITDYRAQSKSLEAVVEHHTMTFLLLGDQSAERVQTAVVSANFFDVLGVKPLLGRTFVDSDETPSSEAVLVLSHDYWRNRHGADPQIVGRMFRMNNRPHRVIGVLPPIPQYPQESDVYMPTSQCPTRSSQRFIQNRNARMMTAFARLRSGYTLEQARTDLGLIAQRLAGAYPASYPPAEGYAMEAASLSRDLTVRAQPALVMLLAATGLVLLIACANVANLLLARLLRLDREIAVRAALGATRGRLIRQMLTESTLLSLAGGALGILLAPAALKVLVSFTQRLTTRAAEVAIDGPVLWFALAVSLLTGVIFGLIPAFTSSRTRNDALRQGAGRATASAGRMRLRSGLVVAQVAVSFILLTGAGLMLRSFWKLQQVDPGFRPDRLLTLRLTTNFTRFTGRPQLLPFWDQVLLKLGKMPGVESAALVSNPPFSPSGVAGGPSAIQFTIEGRPTAPGELVPAVDLTTVSAGYFRTIRQPLLQGRAFNDFDDAKAPPVCVINQTMARHRWPAGDAIGKRISFDNGRTWVRIEGVVGDVKEYGLDRPMGDEVYLPLTQTGFAGNLVLRTLGDPWSVTNAARVAMREIDPEVALDRIATIEQFREESMTPARITTVLVTLFAILALVISASGIAAVMALAVAQRSHELGIRLALGASKSSLLYLVLRQGLVLTLAGAALGVLGSLAFTRFLSTMLYSTSTTDAVTFIAALAVFLGVAMAACAMPAWRVTGLDPLKTLRSE